MWDLTLFGTFGHGRPPPSSSEVFIHKTSRARTRSRACRFHPDTRSSPWASCWHRATRASKNINPRSCSWICNRSYAWNIRRCKLSHDPGIWPIQMHLKPFVHGTTPSIGEGADHHGYSPVAIRGIVFQVSTGAWSDSQNHLTFGSVTLCSVKNDALHVWHIVETTDNAVTSEFCPPQRYRNGTYYIYIYTYTYIYIYYIYTYIII